LGVFHEIGVNFFFHFVNVHQVRVWIYELFRLYDKDRLHMVVVVMPMEFLVLSLVVGYGLFLLVWSFNFGFLDMFGLLMVVSLWVGRTQRLAVILFEANERLSVDLGLDLFFHLEN
jgi:hypothetical protein